MHRQSFYFTEGEKVKVIKTTKKIRQIQIQISKMFLSSKNKFYSLNNNNTFS